MVDVAPGPASLPPSAAPERQDSPLLQSARLAESIIHSDRLDSERTEALRSLLHGGDSRLAKCFDSWSDGHFVGAPIWDTVGARLQEYMNELQGMKSSPNVVGSTPAGD
eukprot:2812869-Rhodomonas_salina.1